MAKPPRKGASFQSGSYVPELGDVVHLDWNPAVGHEMKAPHYGLVLSASMANVATGMAGIVPITSPRDKLSGAEVAVKVGRVNGVAILSGLRFLDYQNRAIQFEDRADPAVVAEANRRVHMMFPSTS